MSFSVIGSVTALLDAVLPPGCALCGIAVPGNAPPLCDPCESRLPAVNPPWCPRCGATRWGDFSVAGHCSECEAWPRELRRAAAPFRYAAPASQLLRGLKYRGWTALGPRMGAAMRPAALRLVPDGTALLVPVPLAAARRRERGFNQASVLANGLGEVTGWPVVELLKRRRAGPTQASLGRRARSRRVDCLYHLDRGALRGIPGGGARAGPEGGGAGSSALAPVLLVDDVVTTGATASACAAALERSGLTCAGIVSFARALPRPGENLPDRG